MNTRRGSKRLRAALVREMTPQFREEIDGIGVRHEDTASTVFPSVSRPNSHYLVEWDRGGERHILYLWIGPEEKHPEKYAPGILQTIARWPSNRRAAEFFASLSKLAKQPIALVLPYSSWDIVVMDPEHGSQPQRASVDFKSSGFELYDELEECFKVMARSKTLSNSMQANCQIDTLLAKWLYESGLLADHGSRSQGYVDGNVDLGPFVINVSKNGLKQIIAAHRIGGSDTGDVLYEDGNILVEGINLAETVLAGLAGQKFGDIAKTGTRFDDEIIASARNTKTNKKPTLLLRLKSRRITLKKAQKQYGFQEPDLPYPPSLQNAEKLSAYIDAIGNNAIHSDDPDVIEEWLDRDRPPLRPPRYTDPQQVEKDT